MLVVSLTVLHPLTRFDLQLDLLVDRVRIKPLPIDQEVKIGRIRERVLGSSPQRGLQLSLERVHLRPKQVDAPWRYPTVSIETDSIGSYNGTHVNPLDEILSLEVPEQLRQVPLRIGALFSLPWLASTHDGRTSLSHHRKLYRLIVVKDSDQDESSIEEDDEYILSRDVADLVRLRALSPSIHLRLPSATINDSESFYLLRSLRPIISSSEALLSNLPTNHRSCTLVCGEIGSGKSYAALLLGATSQLLHRRSVVYLDCQRLKSARGLGLQGIMNEILFSFQLASRGAPSTLILDDLDELVPRIDTGPSSDSRNTQAYNPALVDQCHAIAGLLSYLLRSATDSNVDIEFVFSVKEAESLADSVRQVFSNLHVVRLPCFTGNDRASLFCTILRRLFIRLDMNNPFLDPETLSAHDFGVKTTSFRPRDLEQLAQHLHTALSVGTTERSHRRLDDVLNEYVPLSQRAAAIEPIRHDYCLEDVGGLFSVKRDLTTTILRPSRYRRIYQNAQIRLPRGILLL